MMPPQHRLQQQLLDALVHRKVKRLERDAHDLIKVMRETGGGSDGEDPMARWGADKCSEWAC